MKLVVIFENAYYSKKAVMQRWLIIKSSYYFTQQADSVSDKYMYGMCNTKISQSFSIRRDQ